MKTEKLLRFLDASPVNFLAVAEMKRQLSAAGFKLIDAAEPLPELKAGDQIMVTKNDSAIFAFRIGKKSPAEVGFKIIGAHSDSPTFRIKPNAEMLSEGGILRLNTEVYGGAVLSTWFDRPLSLAGRVILRSDNPLEPETRLLHIKKPLLLIPNLAIHFNRQVNDGVKINRQKDVLPVMDVTSFINKNLQKDEILLHIICEELNSVGAGLVSARSTADSRADISVPRETGELEGGRPAPTGGKTVAPKDILDFDLYLYDTTPACLVGPEGEFISAGRLDDLSMAHAGLEAMLDSKTTDQTQVLAVFDNEETGSGTKQGAHSPILRNLLERICTTVGAGLVSARSTADSRADISVPRETGELEGGRPAPTSEAFYRSIEKSFMISADNAHAFHPNYAEKYDPTNHPVLGGGPVIKINAAQKYSTDARSAAIFKQICEKAGVPCQTFVNHSEVAGGSTLGNILTAQIPLSGVDMGNPVWAMHSVRETASSRDHEFCTAAFTTFFNL